MSSQVEKNFTSANSNAKRVPPASNANSAKQNKPKLKDEETKEKESIKKTSTDNNKHQKIQDNREQNTHPVNKKKDNKKQEQPNDGKHEELKKVSKNDEKSQVANEKKVSQNNDDTKQLTEDKRKMTKNDTEKKEKPAPPEASPNKKAVDDKKNKDVSNTNVSKDVNKDNAKNKETIKAQVVEDNNVETKENKKTDEKETQNIVTVSGEETVQKANVCHVGNGVEDHSSSNQKTKVKSSPVVKDKVKDSPAKEARKSSSSKPDVIELVDLVKDENESSLEQRKEETVSSSPKKSQEMHSSSSRGRIHTDRSTPVAEEILKISPIGKRVLDKEIEPQASFIHTETLNYKVTLADETKETSTEYEFATPSILERFNSSAHRISGRRSLRSIRETNLHSSYNERYRKFTPEFETTFSSVNATCGSDGFEAPSFSFLSRAGVKRPKSDSSVESSGKLSENDRQNKRPRLDLGGWLSIVASPVTKIYGLFRKNQYDLARDDGDTKSATIEDVSAAEATEVLEIINDEDMQEHIEDNTTIENDDEQDISLLENQNDDDDDEDDSIKDSIKEKLHEDHDAQVLQSGGVSKRRSCNVM